MWGMKPTETAKSGRIVKVGIVGFVRAVHSSALDGMLK